MELRFLTVTVLNFGYESQRTLSFVSLLARQSCIESLWVRATMSIALLIITNGSWDERNTEWSVMNTRAWLLLGMQMDNVFSFHRIGDWRVICTNRNRAHRNSNRDTIMKWGDTHIERRAVIDSKWFFKRGVWLDSGRRPKCQSFAREWTREPTKTEANAEG